MKVIALSETFVSIQGEGVDVGFPAFFIRTGRCNIGCIHCDTKYSWKSKTEATVEEVVKAAEESNLPTVVVTGGEPAEEEALPELLKGLLGIKTVKRVFLETCGHIFRDDLPKDKLTIVLSPKPPSMEVPFPEDAVTSFLRTYRNCRLKFPVLNAEDLATIKKFLLKNRELVKPPIVVQPIEVPNENYTETCKKVIDLVLAEKELLQDFDLRVIPQVHKLLGIR